MRKLRVYGVGTLRIWELSVLESVSSRRNISVLRHALRNWTISGLNRRSSQFSNSFRTIWPLEDENTRIWRSNFVSGLHAKERCACERWRDTPLLNSQILSVKHTRLVYFEKNKTCLYHDDLKYICMTHLMGGGGGGGGIK